MTFENYLKNIHAKGCSVTDDDMPNHFEKWLMQLDIEEIIEYAEMWGKELQK